MKNLKSHFRFNQQERSGIFFLLFTIVFLQVGYFLLPLVLENPSRDSLVVDQKLQSQIDALKQAALEKDSVKMYPFNPNFITDYKGYVLGMSPEELDRLHAFRAEDRYANTPKEFQQVTQISDSLLDAISPYFKFPEWTNRSKKSGVGSTKWSESREKQIAGNTGSAMVDSESGSRQLPYRGGEKQDRGLPRASSDDGPTKDLNTATAEELRTISGIGEKLSARIVKFRDRLGGFLVDDQLYEVYGLEPEVAERTLARFRVQTTPKIQKINLNTASAEELARSVYIQKQVAERIVEYRIDNGNILSLEELKNIEGFPSDKITSIALYLSL